MHLPLFILLCCLFVGVAEGQVLVPFSDPRWTKLNSATVVCCDADGKNFLMLTPGNGWRSGQAWFSQSLAATNWKVKFGISVRARSCSSLPADGWTFTIQTAGLTWGSQGGGLGFAGIPSSVSVVFDPYSGGSPPIFITSATTNGNWPQYQSSGNQITSTNPLTNGDIFEVNVEYTRSNGVIYWTIEGRTTGVLTTHSRFVGDIPTIVGGGAAYIGFTAATGGSWCEHRVHELSYTPVCPANQPVQGSTYVISSLNGRTDAWQLTCLPPFIGASTEMWSDPSSCALTGSYPSCIMPSPTSTPSRSWSSSSTSSLSPSETGTRSNSQTASNSGTRSNSATNTLTRTASVSISFSASSTRSQTPSSSDTASTTGSFTRTASTTSSETATASKTASQTRTTSKTATASLSAASTPSNTPSFSGTCSSTATATVSTSLSPTATVSTSFSQTASFTGSATTTMSISLSPSTTATKTRTASTTRTASGTPSNSGTPTATPSEGSSLSSTSTHSGTSSFSGTSSESATFTRSGTASFTSSRSFSSSRTGSQTPSASSTHSITASFTASSSETASFTASITESASVTLSPRLAILGNLGAGGNGAFAGDVNGTAAGLVSNDGGDSGKMPVAAVAAGAGLGGLIAVLAILCACWWCLLVLPRRKKKEEEAKKKLNRASFALKAKSVKLAPARGGVASALGLPPSSSSSPIPVLGSVAPARKGATSAALFQGFNPALLASARDGSLAPKPGPSSSNDGGAGNRKPRISMALSAYKKPVALSPRKSLASPRAPIALEEEEEEEEEQPLYYEEGQAEEQPYYYEEEQAEEQPYYYYEEEAQPEEEQEQYPPYEEEEAMIGIQDDDDDQAEDDVADDEEDILDTAGRKAAGSKAQHGGWLSNKTKKVAESAVAPPVEDRKLVIGKGALIAEAVTKEVVRLKRVSKIKGDSELSNMRKQNGSRPSTAATPVFAAVVARTRFKVDSGRYGPRESTLSPRKSSVGTALGSRPSVAVASAGGDASSDAFSAHRRSIAAVMAGYNSRPSIALGVGSPRKSSAVSAEAASDVGEERRASRIGSFATGRSPRNVLNPLMADAYDRDNDDYDGNDDDNGDDNGVDARYY